TKACDDVGKARMETVLGKDYILLPLWPADPLLSQSGDSSKDSECSDQKREDNVNNTNNVNAASTNEVNAVGAKISIKLPDDPNMPELEDIVYSDDDEDVGTEADINNLDAFMPVSPIPTIRIHEDHLVEQIIGDLNSVPQTRRMTKNLEEHEEPKKVIHTLKHPSWIEDMQDELLQFKLQKRTHKKKGLTMMKSLSHGRMILESVENGPLIWPTIEENRVTRPKKYSELSATEAIQADCDVKQQISFPPRTYTKGICIGYNH
ncbi:hypothetical protein Tco_1561478, partial [Tanacetum coccineum]